MAENKNGVFTSAVPAIKSFKLGKSVIEANKRKLICAEAQFSFQRQVAVVSPLNLDTKYLMIGEESGNGSLSLIVGPESEVTDFIKEYSDACQGSKDISITAANECESSKGTKFTLKGVVINNITGTVSRQNGMMSATIGFNFVGLEM